MAALDELTKALQVLEKIQDLQKENKLLQRKLRSKLDEKAAQRKPKKLVAQGKSKRQAAQRKLLVPRITTFGGNSAQDVQDALLELGIPVFKVKPLFGAKKGAWLIFLDVHADFTKGTFNAEWLTAVCKGLPRGNIEDVSWTWKFRVFIKEGEDDQAHAELWKNGTFPKEAPASEEPAAKEQTSKEPAAKEQTSEEQDVNALVASGKWGDAEYAEKCAKECAEECAEE